jgi:hypothetical protein
LLNYFCFLWYQLCWGFLYYYCCNPWKNYLIGLVKAQL